tara:strand:- start:358 stop:660 length:303 start_codon:yes stop_codon:yes gene_type:complete
MPKPVELHSFTCEKYLRVCGMHQRIFSPGLKKGCVITYHHPHGIVVERPKMASSFVPITAIDSFVPKNEDDLLEALGVEKPKPPAKPKKPKKVKEPKAAE